MLSDGTFVLWHPCVRSVASEALKSSSFLRGQTKGEDKGLILSLFGEATQIKLTHLKQKLSLLWEEL